MKSQTLINFLSISVILSISSSMAMADNPTATINITGNVISKTCSFDKDTHPVVLDDIAVSDFTDSAIKKSKSIPITISCGNGVSTVNIITDGKADDNDRTAFQNSGESKNVALRLQDNKKNTLKKGDKVTVTPSNGTGSYTFNAGYVAVKDGVSAGTFSSTINLIFDYN